MRLTTLTICLLIITILCIELWSFINLLLNNNSSKLLDVKKSEFDGYLKSYNRSYSGEEYDRRFENFKVNVKEIDRLNELEGRTVFGLTKFSDMSKKEFASRLFPHMSKCKNRYFKCNNSLHLTNDSFNSKKYEGVIPTKFDWREKGVVKPVLDQKLCQGCWAFSIIGVLESMSALQKQDTKSRSIQELLDCSQETKGCIGGNTVLGLEYLCRKHVPVVTEEEYPLTLSVDQVCKLPKTKPLSGRKVLEFAHQCGLDESLLLQQLVNHGPLIAAVDASNWLYYIDGVITRACRAGISNHVVQIEGYNMEASPPYFIVRNSFGEDWGEKGYVRIAMHNNICGITDQITIMNVY